MSQFVSPELAAATLNVNVSTIRKWTRLGIIPTDKTRNIPKSDFELWLTSENGARIQQQIDINRRSFATEAELQETVIYLELHA